MAVLRALVFEPNAVEAHEIAKPSGVGIPRMLHKGGEAGRQNVRKRTLASFIERAGQQQRACIVIDAIAVRAVGYRMHGVLKQSGIVAHRQEMRQLHVRRR